MSTDTEETGGGIAWHYLLLDMKAAELLRVTTGSDDPEVIQAKISAVVEEIIEEQAKYKKDREERRGWDRCECGDVWAEGACKVHTVGHYHADGCCAEPEDKHRHMTKEEWEKECPLVFKRQWVARRGEDQATYELKARRYQGRTGFTITRLFEFKDEEEDDEPGGLCFDFSEEARAGLVDALNAYAESNDS